MSIEDSNRRTVTLAFVEARRHKMRDSLSAIYLPFYDDLINELEKTSFGDFFAPYSGRRTMEEQAALYSRGRTAEDVKNRVKIVTYAKAGDSAHNWGCATDWCEFQPTFAGQDVWNKANWSYFAQCVRKVGLVWGGDFMSIKDKPHCELMIHGSWSKVGKVYRDTGSMEKGEEAIKSLLVKGGNLI